MSGTSRRPRRGNIKWTAEAVRLLGTDTDAAVARKLGLKLEHIAYQRRKLGIPPHKRKFSVQRRWTDEELALLGTMPDSEVAKRVGRSAGAVMANRIHRGIPGYNPRAGRMQAAAAAIGRWEYLAALSQPDFYKAIADGYERVTGEALTHRRLSEMTLWSISRIQKWFTPGSAQQPLQTPVRHHIYLAVQFAITSYLAKRGTANDDRS